MIKKVFDKNGACLSRDETPSQTASSIYMRIACNWNDYRRYCSLCSNFFLKKMIKVKVRMMKIMERKKIIDDF